MKLDDIIRNLVDIKKKLIYQKQFNAMNLV
jgi:hypothetical protein